MNHVYLILFLLFFIRFSSCDTSIADEDETDKTFFIEDLPKNISTESFYTLEFIKQLLNYTRTAGGELKVSCEATLKKVEPNDEFMPFNYSLPLIQSQNKSEALIKKLKIRWLKNEAPLEADKGRVFIRKHIDVAKGAVSSALIIRNLDTHDKAFYTCIAGIEGKQIRSNGILEVRNKLLDDRVSPSFKPFINKVTYTPDPTIASKNESEIRSSPNYDLSFTKQVFSPSIGKETPEDFITKIMTTNSYPTSKEKEVEMIVPTPPPLGLCQPYKGPTCSKFLQNQPVYIPYPVTQAALEEKLSMALKVIQFSNEMSSTCESYALPSLCYSTFPVCRFPDETNKLFFKYFNETFNSKNAIQKSPTRKNTMEEEDSEDEDKIVFENLPAGGLPPHLDPNIKPSKQRMIQATEGFSQKHNFLKRTRHKRNSQPDIEFHINTRTKTIISEKIFVPSKHERHIPVGPTASSGFSISRSTLPLRRVCREDCEILENELCQKEYAIAKRHPEIGQKLTLEECVDLPADSPDCLDIGIDKHVSSDDMCFWENGVYYRGSVNTAISGLPCIKWSHQITQKIANHPELSGGHNYCRNPGGKEPQPWCFIEKGTKNEKQMCDVPKCSHKLWMYIISSIAGICLLFTFCIVCLCCRHRSSKNNTAAIRNINLPNADKNIYGNSRLNSPIELSDLLNGQNNLGHNPSSRTNGILRVPQYTLSNIKFVEELGEGAFGKVYKGELIKDNETIFVAVKALKENASPKTQLDFKREIELISELRHENIVCILGVVLREEPLCMLFEFMAKGDLHEFLMEKAPPEGPGLSPVQFMSIARHIAAGMEYLAAHHYVHRDLAARNCLVADNLIVKISDFGLSRDIYSSDYYRVQSKSLLPVRWMPPESILYGKFTTESDVWSYGVVLWEIYSYGLQPYYGYSNQEVISMVRGRELLQCPASCPRPIFSLMRECWHQTPSRRPNFTLITNRLTSWLHPNSTTQGDTTSDSSMSLSGQRGVGGDPRERMPLIGQHSSSNGSLAGSMPRKLSIRSHASTRLMMSSSDVTSASDNCHQNLPSQKASCGSLLDTQSQADRLARDTVVKIPTMSQPYDI